MRELLRSYIELRYGDSRHYRDLKPPLGFHRIYAPRNLLWRAGYYLRVALWRMESLAWRSFLKPAGGN